MNAINETIRAARSSYDAARNASDYDAMDYALDTMLAADQAERLIQDGYDADAVLSALREGRDAVEGLVDYAHAR